jgi:hypothetical protein
MLVDDTTVSINELSTGEVFGQHAIQPDNSYWPNLLKR